MEVDLAAPVRIRLLQRPSRPSVESLSAMPLQNSNSVGSATAAATSASSSSSDPYHLPTPVRLRDSRKHY